jgi:hypothetical protein
LREWTSICAFAYEDVAFYGYGSLLAYRYAISATGAGALKPVAAEFHFVEDARFIVIPIQCAKSANSITSLTTRAFVVVNYR